METTEWKDLYTKAHKGINITMLENYLLPEALVLFHKFDGIMRRHFGIGTITPSYSTSKGWMYQYGYSGFVFVRSIYFHNRIFNVEKIDIKDEESLNKAVEIIQYKYDNDLKKRFEEFKVKRSESQKARNQRRLEREKKELEQNETSINKEKFNIYKWSPKVPLDKLHRLYESDASGILDSDLLDDIGYSFYTRCDQGLCGPKCTNCNEKIVFTGGKNNIITCKCGYQYTYRGYKESYYKSKVPHGAALPAFKQFMADWEKAKTDSEKMISIDILIHAFHVSIRTGRGYGSVAANLLQGTTSEHRKLLNNLAYGENSIANLNVKKQWSEMLNR